MFCTFSLPNVLFATAACIFSTGEQQRVLRTWRVLCIFTSKCAFRHSGVHFSTGEQQKVLRTWRALYISLQNVLFATAACIFSTGEQQKVLRTWRVLCIFTSKCAFATAACNFWFLLWAATSAPAALTGLLLDWPDTRIIEKTQHFATSLTFGADVSSFFWLSRYCIFLSADLTTLLCFSTVHIVGSFYLNFLRPITTSTTVFSINSYKALVSSRAALRDFHSTYGFLLKRKPGWNQLRH